MRDSNLPAGQVGIKLIIFSKQATRTNPTTILTLPIFIAVICPSIFSFYSIFCFIALHFVGLGFVAFDCEYLVLNQSQRYSRLRSLYVGCLVLNFGAGKDHGRDSAIALVFSHLRRCSLFL